jgi:hypothetical protein
MDISRLIIHPIGLKNYACDPSDGHSSVCYYTCCSSSTISNCARRNDENLAGSIVSEVLKGGDADDETDQDSPNTVTLCSALLLLRL